MNNNNYQIVENLFNIGIPIEFFPNAHIVWGKLVSLECHPAYYNKTRMEFTSKFNFCEIPAHNDEKIVFCVEFYDVKIYFGFSNFKINIGLFCSKLPR